MHKIIFTTALFLSINPNICYAETLDDLLVRKGVISGEEQAALSDNNTQEAKVYWKGGTRIELPAQGITAKINTQLQPRYEYTSSDDGSDDKSSFRMRRARFQIEGAVLDEEFKYKLQTDLVGSKQANGARGGDLRDAYIEWRPYEQGAFRLGQFKTQISRQENASAFKRQFPDPTEASDYYTLSRAQGAALTSTFAEALSLTGGIYNGESDDEGRNLAGVDTDHTFDIGLRADLLGKMDAFTEGDIDSTQETAINIGAAYSNSDANRDYGIGSEAVDIQRVSSDFNVKYQGASLHSEVFWMDLDSSTSMEDFTSKGGYVQLGYFFVPQKWELAGRWATIGCYDGMAPGECSGNDSANEAGASLNHFFLGHALKAQLSYKLVNENPEDSTLSDVNTNIWIFQLSSDF